MGYTKEQRIINAVSGSTRQQRETQPTNLTGTYDLPNNSGDHRKSIKRDTPTQSYDLVNKEYVDAGDLWTRTGTVLSPKTAEDVVEIDAQYQNGQQFKVMDGTHSFGLIATDVSYGGIPLDAYWTGTGWTSTGTGSALIYKTPTGLAFYSDATTAGNAWVNPLPKLEYSNANNIWEFKQGSEVALLGDDQALYFGSSKDVSLLYDDDFFISVNSGATILGSDLKMGTSGAYITQSSDSAGGYSRLFVTSDNTSNGVSYIVTPGGTANRDTNFQLRNSPISTSDTGRVILWAKDAEARLYAQNLGSPTTSITDFNIGALGSGIDICFINNSNTAMCIDDTGTIEVKEDLFFSGSGSGLPYGEVYVEANTTATTISVQNTWYQFTGFDTNGQSNLTTPDHTNDHITVTKAGVYKIDFNASFTGGTGKTYEIAIQKNNGATVLTNIHVERKLGSTDIGVVSASGFCSCSANDTIELWIRCTDVTTANATLRDVNLNLVQIGG